MFGGLGNIFGAGKKDVDKPVQQAPAALPGEQQGRKVTPIDAPLAFTPAAPAPAAAGMEGKKVSVQAENDKTEVLRSLLANATLEEKRLLLNEMNSSLKEDFAPKNKEVGNFLKNIIPPRSYVNLEKILPSARKYADSHDFRVLISNCSGVSRPPSEEESEEYRLKISTLYKYVAEFESNPQSFDPSEYSIYHLFVLLSCDGLYALKPKIVESILDQFSALPLEKDAQAVSGITGKRLGSMLQVRPLTGDEVKALMRHTSPTELLNGHEFQQLVIPKYFTNADYQAEVLSIINSLSDESIKNWIEYRTDDYETMDMPLSYLGVCAKELAVVGFENEAFVNRISQLSSGSKSSRIKDFVDLFKKDVSSLRNVAELVRQLKSEFGDDHHVLEYLRSRRDFNLEFRGHDSALASFRPSVVDPQLISRHESAFLNAMDLASLIHFRHHFSNQDAFKKRLVEVILQTPNDRLARLPELDVKVLEMLVSDHTEVSAKLYRAKRF